MTMPPDDTTRAFDPDDPVAELATYDPVADELLDKLARGPRARADLARILATPRRRWWQRPRLVLPTIVVLLLGGGAVAYAAVSGPSDPTTVACYAGVSLESNITAAATGAAGPLATCRQLWQAGRVGPSRGNPPLTDCLLRSRLVGVFPSSDPAFCSTLGLSPAGPPTPEADRIIRLREQITTAITSARCLAPTAARSAASRDLARLGLAGWRVRIARDGEAGPVCSSLALDSAQHLVLIVPVPPPPG